MSSQQPPSTQVDSNENEKEEKEAMEEEEEVLEIVCLAAQTSDITRDQAGMLGSYRDDSSGGRCASDGLKDAAISYVGYTMDNYEADRDVQENPQPEEPAPPPAVLPPTTALVRQNDLRTSRSSTPGAHAGGGGDDLEAPPAITADPSGIVGAHSVSRGFPPSDDSSILSVSVNDQEQQQQQQHQEEQLLEATLVEEGGNVAVAVPAADSDSKSSRRKAFRCLLLVVVLLLIGLVVAITVPLTTTQNQQQDEDDVDTTTTTEPPPQEEELEGDPSTTTTTTRLDQLRTFYVENNVTLQDSLFDDPETPQYRALHWIADEDELQVTLEVQGEMRVTQRYVLAVLFFSTRGHNWEETLDFLTTEHECLWKTNTTDPMKEKGITLCNGDASISDIKLYWNNLNGTIPKELNALSSMRYLHLNINHLYGTIPDEIFTTRHLDMLRQLILNNNNLEGTVPDAALANIPSLESLGLFANPRLTGNLDFPCAAEEFFWSVADCAGGSSAPPVTCACCTYCCDSDQICCANKENSTDCGDWTPKKNW